MIARISTQFQITHIKFWDLITQPDSLVYVSAPLLNFIPDDPEKFSLPWEIGVEYRVHLKILGFFPAGVHTIRLVEMDPVNGRIVSHESGTLSPIWNHVIQFKQIQPGVLSYSDEIEIKAGWLTPLVWLFAQVFYRHRQRRWKNLIKRETMTPEN